MNNLANLIAMVCVFDAVDMWPTRLAASSDKFFFKLVAQAIIHHRK